MRIAFCTLMNLLAFCVAFGYPFVTGLRGKRSAGSVVLAWGGIFLWAVLFSLGVPAVVSLFSQDLAREMQLNWLPTPQGIPLVAVLGWLMPALAALTGHFTRWLLRALWPAALLGGAVDAAGDDPKC